MKTELSEKTRVAMLKLIAASCLFFVGVFLIVCDADLAVNSIGLLSYVSGAGLFFSIEGKRKAINEYRKFIKS